MNANDLNARLRSAESLEKKGDFQAALVAYREVIQLTPEDPFLHMKLGELLQENYEYESAIAAYREAVRLRPSYYRVHYDLGYLLMELGRLSEAAAHLREFLSYAPKSTAYQARAARVQEDLQDMDSPS